MTERINKLIAELEARLAVCEATTGAPWGIDGEGVYGGRGAAHRDIFLAYAPGLNNSAFIAASRNQRPAELRALIVTLKGLRNGVEYGISEKDTAVRQFIDIEKALGESQ